LARPWRVLVVLLFAVVGLQAVGPAPAGAQQVPGMPPMPAPVTPGTASAATPDPVTTLDNVGAFAPEPAPVAPLAPPASTAGYVPQTGFFDTIRESLLGDAYAKPSTWHALPLTTFFTQGWNEAWVLPTAGSGGAPRQGWINSFDGQFFRAWFVVFAYQQDLGHNGSGYVGSYTIYVPLNRRFEVRIDEPFAVSNKGGQDNTYHTNSGDLIVSPRVLLSESKDVSQVLSMPVRMPTGRVDNGNGISSLGPQYQFWWNIAGKWALRGGNGLTIPTGGSAGRTTYNASLGLGRYWPGADDAWIRQFWIHLSTNLTTTIAGSGPNATYFALSPGIRFQITGLWYFLAAVEVPVTGPKAFDYAPILLLLKDY
jgi:hypothetical protein